MKAISIEAREDEQLSDRGRESKPFLQAVMEDWLREKQKIREKIDCVLASEEPRPVIRRRAKLIAASV